jgi:hypothetical protein
MKSKLIVVSIALLAVVAFCSSSFAATEDDILRRLEKMEQEIKSLKAENSELRETVQEEQVKVDTDRKAITELKKSAGKGDANGMRAVLGKYDMELYGRVKVDLNYDTAEFSKYGDLIGTVDPDGTNDSTNFNPKDSRIGLKVKRRDGVWLSEARIELDFYGDSPNDNLEPRMRLGYVKLTNDDWKASLLVGQDWIPIASLNPPTIEFGVLSSSGNLWWRLPQVTFRKQLCNFELMIGAMKHERKSYEEEDRMPWAVAKISYKDGILGKGGLLALGGGYKKGEIGSSVNGEHGGGENINGKDNDVDRWLVALEFKIKRGRFTFLAEPWIGTGLGQDFLRYGMADNYDGDNPNAQPDTILSRGGFAALKYKANQKVNLAAGYGIDDPDNDDMRGMLLGIGQFTRSETFFANGWYQVTSAVKMGVEVMYLETERFGDSDNGMRYTFSTCYDF